MREFSTDNDFERDAPFAAWLYDPVLQKLLTVLSENGEEARVVGGIVRDALLARFSGGVMRKTDLDIDIAVTLLPEAAARKARQNGFHIVPLGEEFGTILVLDKSGRKFQVTTLRADVKSNGRHAEVRFCRDWLQDALRRDFTVNALYVDKNGRLYDDVGGAEDIKNRVLRFIGGAEARIKEDYLRILRFFRFYAQFAQTRPDREAIKAVASLKGGLQQLSKERVWEEFKKLLALPNPAQSLLWMRVSGVLAEVLPENGKWGLEILRGLTDYTAQERLLSAKKDDIKAEKEEDALLRLMALIPPQKERVTDLARRLPLSVKERRRLLRRAEVMPAAAHLNKKNLKRQVYAVLRRQGGAMQGQKPQALSDSLRLARAAAHIYGKTRQAQLYSRLLHLAENWQETMPELGRFPLKGEDMIALGLQGRAVGAALKKLETAWIDSDFTLNKQALLKKL